MRPPVGATFLAVTLFFTALSASAQSRRVIDYFYDDAGNLVRIESSESLNPPNIETITPAFIRRGPVVPITATGTDLRLAEVTSPSPEILVTNVQSTPTTVTFDIQATDSSPLGPVTLTFATRLGSDTAQITVLPFQPKITVSPKPLTVALGQTLDVEIELSTADVINHTLTLSTINETVASVSPSTIDIASGDLRSSLPVTLTGASLGTTHLLVSTPELDDIRLTIFVTNAFQADPGDHFAFSGRVGVVKAVPDAPPVDSVVGPLVSIVSVLKQADPPPPETFDALLVAPNVGVTLGNFILGISPRAVIAGGGPVTFTVSGVGLAGVNSVQAVPPDDVTISGFAASADGTTLDVTLEVDAGAAKGQRRLSVESTSGVLQPVAPESDRFLVTGPPPTVDSVSPPVVLINSARTDLIVRGREFESLIDVEIFPSDEITVGTPQVNGDGTEVAVSISVSQDALEGERILVVTTLAGSSSNVQTPANTIRIVNGPVKVIAPLVAPLVEVIKETTP